MAFKTHKDIYLALIDGAKITKGKSGHYLEMIDGKVEWEDGKTSFEDFADYKDWSIYEEPKPKKKVTLYNYTYESKDEIYETGFSSLDFNMLPLFRGKLLKTESKEVEYDDV